MGITQEELATHLNLHRGSVARILSGRGNGYAERTKRRVLEAAAEMGYQPNHAARALVTGATQMVELWVRDYDRYSPYYSYVHHCLQRLGIQRGYQLLTEDVSCAVLKQTGVQGIGWPVDGILACDMTPEATEYIHSNRGRRRPLVCLGHGDTSEMDCVNLDLYAGAREAMKHLLAAGCQRIALVGPSSLASLASESEPRARAYAEAMGEAGKPTECIVTADGLRPSGYQAMRDYLAEHRCPDGLFCRDDEVAIGVWTALSEAGIRVPDDVLLVGFDGLDNARLLPCPISSVVVPVEEMCSMAWDMLQQRLQDPEAPRQHRTLSTHLEVRASSRR
jgi:DNA-binding LacI/PurR family transcriptional regulator